MRALLRFLNRLTRIISLVEARPSCYRTRHAIGFTLALECSSRYRFIGLNGYLEQTRSLKIMRTHLRVYRIYNLYHRHVRDTFPARCNEFQSTSGLLACSALLFLDFMQDKPSDAINLTIAIV